MKSKQINTGDYVSFSFLGNIETLKVIEVKGNNIYVMFGKMKLKLLKEHIISVKPQSLKKQFTEEFKETLKSDNWQSC